jgi:GxxExxY protein
METKEDELSHRIIGAALEVHKALGPGLLESAYQKCLCRELSLEGIDFEYERYVPIEYKGLMVQAYRADIVVEGLVIVEIKAVSRLTSLFAAQVLTYLRASGLRLGLLLNFNSICLRDGIWRVVNNL